MSVVVLVRARPALPATVTSGTPAAMLVCRSECTVLWGQPGRVTHLMHPVVYRTRVEPAATLCDEQPLFSCH